MQIDVCLVQNPEHNPSYLTADIFPGKNRKKVTQLNAQKSLINIERSKRCHHIQFDFLAERFKTKYSFHSIETNQVLRDWWRGGRGSQYAVCKMK